MNAIFSTDYNGNHLSLIISNLLNEGYQRPEGYLQDGRQINFGLKRKY